MTSAALQREKFSERAVRRARMDAARNESARFPGTAEQNETEERSLEARTEWAIPGKHLPPHILRAFFATWITSKSRDLTDTRGNLSDWGLFW